MNGGKDGDGGSTGGDGAVGGGGPSGEGGTGSGGGGVGQAEGGEGGGRSSASGACGLAEGGSGGAEDVDDAGGVGVGVDGVPLFATSSTSSGATFLISRVTPESALVRASCPV